MRNARKILVVEDSFAVKKRLCMALESAGYSIDTASNGKEAWMMSRRKQYDIVVTDQQMPIMSGQDLCLRLRADKRYENTPIIFLTSAREKLDASELLRVEAIFDKPFNPQLIVNFIDAYNATAV